MLLPRAVVLQRSNTNVIRFQRTITLAASRGTLRWMHLTPASATAAETVAVMGRRSFSAVSSSSSANMQEATSLKNKTQATSSSSSPTSAAVQESLKNNPPSSPSSGFSTKTWLALIATGGLSAAAYKYFHDHFGGTEGLYRAIFFYSIAIPKYFVYRFHQWQESPQETWDELDRATSAQGLDIMLHLKGFYIKCGQMCACNIGDAFPQIWQDTMSVLQDQVPPEDFETVILPIVKGELDFAGTFASFDPQPIGSASIGQVHRATLKDGRPVVVKICYPHVERLLRGDVRTIRAFCEVAQPVHVPAIKEVEKQWPTEFDYRTEAENLEAVRNNLTKAGLCGPGKLCVVPKPYLEHCTKRVLVMEELVGEKLIDALKRDVKKWASLAGMTVEELAKQEKGKTAEEYEAYLATLDAKRRAENAWKLLRNSTVGLVAKSKDYQTKAELPLNHAKLVDDLIHIHGHEVLVDGRYNADCHPGNVLLTRQKDGSPSLGLIDYGQTKTLCKEDRHRMCRIIIALDDDNREEIVRLMKEAGFYSKHMDPEVIFLYAKVSYDQDSKELTGGKHIQMFMEDLQHQDPIIALPESFLMVARTSIFLRGLGHSLKQHRSIAKLWRPIAERVLREDL